MALFAEDDIAHRRSRSTLHVLGPVAREHGRSRVLQLPKAFLSTKTAKYGRYIDAMEISPERTLSLP
jgi:hypothetical protein